MKAYLPSRPNSRCASPSGGSPGLVVMGGDSRSKGRGFESPAPYTGWTFFHIYVKICNVCLNKKEAGVGPFFKK